MQDSIKFNLPLKQLKKYMYTYLLIIIFVRENNN